LETILLNSISQNPDHPSRPDSKNDAASHAYGG
jgi:hypothetical protein